MPLRKRVVEPVCVSRCQVPTGVRDDLEFVSNSTLSHIVLQLGSLSRLADDLFNELHRETSGIVNRTRQLMQRTDNIKLNIIKLNPVVEEVLLQDINLRKPFTSSVTKDQQIVTVSTRPTAVLEMYAKCEQMPSLYKLNVYREDGKDSTKFYTDPGYFFELWCHEITKDAEDQMKKHKLRAKRTGSNNEPRAVREPKSHLEEANKRRHGQEFINTQHAGERKGSSATLGRNDPGLTRKQFDPGETGSRLSDSGVSSLSRNDSWSMRGGAGGIGGVDSRNNSPFQTLPANENGYGNNRSNEVFNGPMSSVNQGQGRAIQGQGRMVQNIYDQGCATRDNSGHSGVGKSPQYRVSSSRPTMSPPGPPPGKNVRPTEGGFPPPEGCISQKMSTSMGHSSQLSPVLSSHQSGGSVRGRSTGPDPARELSDLKNVIGRTGSLRREDGGSPRVLRSDSFDLPPPPTPTDSDGTYIDIGFAASPPPLSPLAANHNSYSGNNSIPPPPMHFNDRPVGGAAHSVLMGALLLGDRSSVNSEGSAMTGSSSQVAPDVDAPPMVRDTRCDLLAAIREGHQLRRVEAKRAQSVKRQQRQTSVGQLDVQSIMEAAFEMRRKALEDNDSAAEDDRDEADEGDWADD